MPSLPDDALVVRGGQNRPENFANGTGVTVSRDGTLDGVSVNAAAGVTVDDLTASNAHSRYPGILNNQIGVTTVGEIRANGGDVIPSASSSNRYHATLRGLTPDQA